MKIKIHSIVDVITNSSTVIYTYQNSTKQAKELVEEVLKLCEIDKTPDDIFWFGVFCDADYYTDYLNENDINLKGYPEDYKKQNVWMEEFFLKIMKGDVELPEWFSICEDGGDYWDPDSYLYILPKDDKYNDLGIKIKKLLGSVSADGGREG